MNSRIMLLVTCLFLFATSLNAEEPTLRLIPTGIITGPTDVVVEAVMPTEGSLELGAAVIVFQFDPSKVVISNPRASAGWDAPTTNNNTTAGLYHAVTCSATGLSATGPLLTLTVSPTGTSADLSDCSTFQLLGGDQVTDTGSNISASDVNGFYSYYPPGSCGQRGTGISDDTDSTGDGILDGGAVDSTSDGNDGIFAAEADSYAASCASDIVAAANALRMAAGLSPARTTDVDFLDRNGDRHITLLDAVSILRDPCPGPERSWSLGFTNAMSSSPPAIADIDRSPNGYAEVVVSSDWQNPPNWSPDVYRANNPNQVWVISDTTGYGDYGIRTGWPRPLRDAINGITVADFTPNPDRETHIDPMEVFANNFQDNTTTGLDSHLNIWDGFGGTLDVNKDGVWDFASDSNPDNPNGVGTGHAFSAPAVYDFDGDGVSEVFFHYQGQWDVNSSMFLGGGMKVMVPRIVDAQTNSTTHFQTSTDIAQPWYIRANDALFDHPPVFPNFETNPGHRNVVLAAETGYLYAWDPNGNPVPGWEPEDRNTVNTLDNPTPTYTDFLEYYDEGYWGGKIVSEPATLYTPIAAGNVDSDTADEVVAAAGLSSRYYGFCKLTKIIDNERRCVYKWPEYTLDGAVYCWEPSGALKWRYPSYVPGQRLQSFLPAFTSGVSLGRLYGPSGPVCAVVGDVNGQVTALDASLPTTATDAQRVKWRFQTHSPVHIGYRQIRTQPLIADVNGDLQQDVVVGTSDGYVYALNGATGQELWHVRTFAGTMDTVWPDEQGRNVTESHYEEVRGLAVGNLFGRDRTRATIVVCSATLQTEDAKPRGHVLVLDCGSGTWNPELADWPQWGRTAQRTGSLGLP